MTRTLNSNICWSQSWLSVEQQSKFWHLVTSAFNREQLEWMTSSPDTSGGHKHPRTRSVTQRVEENSAVVDQQHTSRRWSSIADLTNSQSDGDQSEEVSFYDI